MNRVRNAKPDEIHILKEIFDEGIGNDYYTIDDLFNYINDVNCMLMVATDEDDIPIAVMSCKMGSLEDMCIDEHVPYPNTLFENYNKNTKTVVYKTAATRKEARGQGCVHKLFESFDEYYDTVEHKLKLGLAIITPDGSMPIEKHVVSSGFKPVKLIEKPWSKIKSYCKYCSNDYCQCDAMLFVKENEYEK